MPKIRVLIADDHALVRSGLRALLEAQGDIEVVAEAESGVAVETLCRQFLPDVVLMDLAMPGRGGIAATDDVRRGCRGARVLILSMHDDETYVRLAARAGASGFVLKRSLATELVEAIRAVHRGDTVVPREWTDAFAEVAAVQRPAASHRNALDVLSPREMDVLRLVALGHTNQEIAARLCISEKTVETHRAHVFSKLGLRTRADLVRFALEHGLLAP
jgi:two-component system, NarL family, response regulator NreC